MVAESNPFYRIDVPESIPIKDIDVKLEIWRDLNYTDWAKIKVSINGRSIICCGTNIGLDELSKIVYLMRGALSQWWTSSTKRKRHDGLLVDLPVSFQVAA